MPTPRSLRRRPPRSASTNGVSEFLEHGREPAVEAALGVRRVGRVGDQFRREPRGDRERHRERDQHPHARVDRDRAHVGSHEPGDERHRQERRDHRERREDRRPADLVNGARDERDESCPWLEHPVPMNVLDDDDRIVDQDPDREDQREQAYAVQRETPRPRSEQRGGEREDHRHADDRRLAPAQRHEHQRDHRKRREQQLRDQEFRFVARRLSVVAGDGRFDAGRDHGVLQLRHPLLDALCDVDRVLARLFRDGDGNGGIRASYVRRDLRPRLADAVPREARRRRRAVDDGRDVGEIHRLPVADPHDQALHVLRGLQELARLDQDRLVAADEIAGRQCRIGGDERARDVGRREACPVELVDVEQDAEDAAGSADRRHLAGAGYALQFRLDGVCDALEVESAASLVARPQRDRDDRHVVDALGLHQRLADAELLRQPVAM